MAKCEDCETPVVWLKKPDGGWLPPVEPLFDFAYNDHYVATVDGIAQAVPQVYKRHECLSWEEKQLKMLEREREKQALIEADRARRAEAERVRRELEEAREAQEEAERRLQEELERQVRKEQRREQKRRQRKLAEQRLEHLRSRFSKRLLPIPCRDCGAEENEPCRTAFWREGSPDWTPIACNARYADAPPDDRLRLHLPQRWGDDLGVYRNGVESGTTPETVGPWPPPDNDPGRYDMVRFLRAHYVDVFEPEKRWLTDDEQRNLTDWLLENRGLFEIEEARDDARGVGEEDAGASPEGTSGRDAEGGDREAGSAGEARAGGLGVSGAGGGEHEDRDPGTEWPMIPDWTGGWDE